MSPKDLSPNGEAFARSLGLSPNADDYTPDQLEAALEALAGEPVTVTLKGWEWAGLVTGLTPMLPLLPLAGFNDRAAEDLASVLAQIEAQARPKVADKDLDKVRQKLRESGL